jgi:hypothetical protein
MSDLLQRTLASAGENGTATVTLVEVGKRSWRVLFASGAPRPKLTDETELVAVSLGLREQSRGRGSQPIPAKFGLELAGQLASHAGHAVWTQVLGGAETREGWVTP